MVNALVITPDLTSDLAYLCGVFAGDGSIGVRKEKHEYSLKCVGNPCDEQEFYHQIVQPVFTRVFGFSPPLQFFDRGTTFGFRVHSKALVEFLTAEAGLPIGRKYSAIRVPDCFLTDELLLHAFLRGLFDTDGCISFKKRYRQIPYYPVISLSSKSEFLVRQVSNCLKEKGFRVVELYNYVLYDGRAKDGFTVISRIDLNGRDNLSLWMRTVALSSPKHLEKIRKWGPVDLLLPAVDSGG